MKNLRTLAIALLLGVATSITYNSKPTYSGTQNKIPLSGVWDSSLKAPYETNSFFQNMVVDSGNLPIDVIPYLARIERGSQGLGISWHTKDAVIAGNVTTIFDLDWAITPQTGIFESHKVTKHDKLSVTVKSTLKAGSMTFPLVRGSAFISMIVDDLAPILYTPRGIQKVTDATDTEVAKQASSNKFVITLGNGDTWVLYASQDVKILRTSNQIRFQGHITGKLRIAYIGKDNSNLPVYEKFKDAIPVSGSISYYTASVYAYINFAFNCESLSGAASPRNALIFALPHHLDSLYKPNIQDLKFKTVRGTITAIAKNKWYMKETLTLPTWQDQGNPISFTSMLIFKSTLTADIDHYADPARQAEFPIYRVGVQINRLARLALIADYLSESSHANKARDAIKRILIPRLENTSGNKLLYDTVYGGIITDQDVKGDVENSINSEYFSHHHDYGYLIYGAAVVGKVDSAFLTKYKDVLLELVRDYANPSQSDPYFPFSRQKDWYRGHSWCGGLAEYDDNRNEQSVSESIHSYYAISLLGEALNDVPLKVWGSLLATTEIRSAKKYYQMPDDSVYPEVFAKNRMVGTMWSTKVDYRMYFGDKVEYMHGMNMLPFSPITTKLLSYSYILKEYQVFGAADPKDEWLSYQIMAEAVINPVTAFTRATTVQINDFGRNSRTNMLWWILTRKVSISPFPYEKRQDEVKIDSILASEGKMASEVTEP